MTATPATPAMTAWHALSAAEAIARLEAREEGLSDREAAARLAREGPNALPETPPRSLAAIFLRQLASPLIYLLFGAAALAWVLGESGDAVVILAVVLLNAVIGALQEGRAERSMRALRRLAEAAARVVRSGREVAVPAHGVVRGDVILLAAGGAVPADARLVEAAALETAEAALTGESVPVAKTVDPLAPDAVLGDRRSMVYSGTTVAAGRGRAVVVATGTRTEIGRIAALTQAAGEPPTPLERRIARFGRALVIAAGVLFAAILALGLARGLPLSDVLLVAVSQVVSMVPEGLPVAMTVGLAVGMQRMAARRAIVRRMAAVEALGSTTVILSDKTGTLTKNEMTVTRVWVAGDPPFAPSQPAAEPPPLAPSRQPAEPPPLALSQQTAKPAATVEGREGRERLELRRALLEAAVLCNDAVLGPGGKPTGDPTEAALLAAARDAGIGADALRARLPRTGEIPFAPAARLMATAHADERGPFVVVKGAPEAVLGLLERGGDEAAARAEALAMAEDALRVLAFAAVRGPLDRAAGFEGLRGRARLLGLIGQMDPPRPEAREAVRTCREAGIRLVMVTGDHRATALAIARDLDIAREGDVVLEGRELAGRLDADLARVAVIARVEPEQKLRIVEAFQAAGEVVAMTGDGVNDAPALARADVGVAMGRSGTEVAKEAAKIVITDDDLATIVRAVAEGRLVYRNLKKALLLLFSTAAAEIVILLGALVAGFPLPFAAVQILWNNVVTEGLITVNLAMEGPEGDEMRRPPISPREPLVTRAMLGRMLVLTPAIAFATLGWFAWHLAAGSPFARAQTAALTVLTVCEWFNVLNCRSERRSALDLSLLRNRWLLGGLVAGNLLHAAIVYVPALNRVFHTAPLPAGEVLAIAAAGSLVLGVEEVRKALARRRAPSGG